jgi:hypothetical protein
VWRVTAPIYIIHVKLMNRALSLEGSADSAARKLALDELWSSAGRSSETAWLTWTGLEWDPFYTCVFAQIAQSKVHKVKLVAFVAGANRHRCWFLSLGDYLALRTPRAHDPDKPSWLLPALQQTNSPGTTMGNYVKALCPRDRGGHETYKDVAVSELPARANAGGFRPGASNMLATYMPAELASSVTGHAFPQALYEYVDATRARAMPGAVVLADWPAFPWGHHGMGPKPASLEPCILAIMELAEAGRVEVLSKLENVIDTAFQISSASPPPLQRSGLLRPMTHAALATQLMYLEERYAAGEMRAVMIKVKTAFDEHFRGVIPSAMYGVPFAELKRWGGVIRAQFDSDSLSALTSKVTNQGIGKVAEVVQQLERTVAGLKSEIVALKAELKITKLNQQIDVLQRSIQGMLVSGSVIDVEAGSPDPLSPSSDMRSPPEARPSGAGEPSGAGGTAGSSSRDDIFGSIKDFGSLLPVYGSMPKPALIDLAGATSGDYYRNVMARGGSRPAGLSDGDGGRVKSLLEWFNAMAYDSEKQLLKPPAPGAPAPDEGERLRVTENLQSLVVARLLEAFGNAASSLRDLPKGILPATGIENRIRGLKKLNIEITPNAEAFHTWRKTYEARPQPAEPTGAAAGKRARKE